MQVEVRLVRLSFKVYMNSTHFLIHSSDYSDKICVSSHLKQFPAMAEGALCGVCVLLVYQVFKLLILSTLFCIEHCQLM